MYISCKLFSSDMYCTRKQDNNSNKEDVHIYALKYTKGKINQIIYLVLVIYSLSQFVLL